MINTKSGLYLLCISAAVLAGCATPRSADSVTLARVAKDYIGVSSIDEITISNVQKLPGNDGPLSLGRTHYRYNVDTARNKKFICDVDLAGKGASGELLGQDVVKCETR